MANKPFFETQPVRFRCTGCGACCIAGPDEFVFTGEEELEAIRNFLGLSRAWFRRRYTCCLEDGDRVLAFNADGGCVFLQSDGRCRVYPVRPLQCRTWPFWPENIANRRSWAATERRCEGIGRGNIVSPQRIRRMLQQHD